jgi:hypothetical protein
MNGPRALRKSRSINQGTLRAALAMIPQSYYVVLVQKRGHRTGSKIGGKSPLFMAASSPL